jgi:phosphinothricin acetyltransferase
MNANKQLKWWVCENEIVGYAYAAYWKSRSAYRYTLETSVYIASDHQKKGIGKKIYSILVEELKTLGFKTLLAGISLPNRGSVLFHENLGFRMVGQLERV